MKTSSTYLEPVKNDRQVAMYPCFLVQLRPQILVKNVFVKCLYTLMLNNEIDQHLLQKLLIGMFTADDGVLLAT